MEVAVVAVEVTVVNVQEVEVIIESIPVLKTNIKWLQLSIKKKMIITRQMIIPSINTIQNEIGNRKLITITIMRKQQQRELVSSARTRIQILKPRIKCWHHLHNMGARVGRASGLAPSHSRRRPGTPFPVPRQTPPSPFLIPWQTLLSPSLMLWQTLCSSHLILW